MGVHTNLCILSTTLYLSLLNISVIFIDGLLDSAYYYPTQKDFINSHSKMNNITNSFFSKKFGKIIKIYDLIKIIKKLKKIKKKFNWILFENSLNYFKHYY